MNRWVCVSESVVSGTRTYRDRNNDVLKCWNTQWIEGRCKRGESVSDEELRANFPLA